LKFFNHTIAIITI